MSEWINIKEQTPPETPFYSIFIVSMYSHYKHKNIIEPLHYINSEWYTMIDEQPLDCEYEVTHWQPLPEPPK